MHPIRGLILSDIMMRIKYILIMKQTPRTKTAKQFTLILHKYHLIKKELNPELLDLFPDMIEALTS